MSMISRRPIKPSDKKIAMSRLNEQHHFSRGQRLGQQIISDEIQFQPVGDPNGGTIEMSSIPVLYILTEDQDTGDDFVEAKRVKLDGTAVGSVLKFWEYTG